MNATSKKRTVTVIATPEKGKPESFDGAVGKFSMNTSISSTEVKANEGITLKISLSGSGNLKLIEAPKVQFPPDFEAYDPEVTNTFKNTKNGITGTKSIDYLVIPRTAGTFVIPSIEFSYFDPATKAYKTFESEEYKITVEKGEKDSLNFVSTVRKGDVQIIGSDIRFIKNNEFKVFTKSSFIFGSTVFYLVYIVPLILLIISYIIWKTARKNNQNIELVKNRRANKITRKRLKQAGIFLKNNNKEKFYDEILNAIMGYFSDKLNISLAELNKDKVREALINYKIDEELIKQTFTLIDSCEFARYSPLSGEDALEKTYKEAGQIINLLERKLK